MQFAKVVKNMSTKKFLKKLANYRCQICGDWEGKIYPAFQPGEKVEIQVHHILPRSEGGLTKKENLIVVCDLCHAVFHPQRWKEYFGSKGTPENMEWIKKEFEEYIKLPFWEKEGE